jgi:hypothetical protein
MAGQQWNELRRRASRQEIRRMAERDRRLTGVCGSRLLRIITDDSGLLRVALRNPSYLRISHELGQSLAIFIISSEYCDMCSNEQSRGRAIR